MEIKTYITKILLDWSDSVDMYDTCTLGLGISTLLGWNGILRYLGFIKGFNILVLLIEDHMVLVLDEFIFSLYRVNT